MWNIQRGLRLVVENFLTPEERMYKTCKSRDFSKFRDEFIEVRDFENFQAKRSQGLKSCEKEARKRISRFENWDLRNVLYRGMCATSNDHMITEKGIGQSSEISGGKNQEFELRKISRDLSSRPVQVSSCEKELGIEEWRNLRFGLEKFHHRFRIWRWLIMAGRTIGFLMVIRIWGYVTMPVEKSFGLWVTNWSLCWTIDDFSRDLILCWSL